MSALTRWILHERRQQRRSTTIAAARTGALTLLFGIWFVFAACAHFSDRAAIYTEGSIRAAEEKWHEYYNATADDCEAEHEPKTQEMEECFGDTYDANAKVEVAIRSVVAMLRAYWTARSQGSNPDFGSLQVEIDRIFQDLPPEARDVFLQYARVPR